MNSLNNFDKLRVYLSGPMQFQREECHIWRDAITKDLIDVGFSEENIIDPVKLQPANEVEYIAQCKKDGDLSKLEEFGRQLIKLDLRFVDVSDFVIVHLFPGVETCGTWDELFMARTQRKPVFVIYDKPIEDISIWLMGRVGMDQIFRTKDEVIDRLRLIQSGEVDPPKGWCNIYDRKDAQCLI